MQFCFVFFFLTTYKKDWLVRDKQTVGCVWVRGGTQYYEMHHVPPKRSPLFKPALTIWPLGLCAATHRPPIFCHSKNPKTLNFWFCHPKNHHFNYLAQTLISHNNWSQDFKGFIACGQLDVLYSTTLSLKDPIIFDLSPKDPLFFGLLLLPKDPNVWGAWWHLYLTLIYECPLRGVRVWECAFMMCGPNPGPQHLQWEAALVW